jgi:SAM-dependent methyltransferase
MLVHAARRLEGLPNVDLVAISGHDLAPVPDASVDVVYCTVVFMHLEEWDRFSYVREAHRVLRPGGRFFCDNVNLDSEDGWKVFQASAAFAPEQRPAHISRCSTAPEIACFLRRAGFRDVRVITPAFWVIGHGVKEAR